MLNKTQFYTLLMSTASVLALAKVVVFASIMSPAEFGSYSLFILLSTFFLFLCGSGVDVSILNGCSRAIARKNKKLLNTNFVSGVALVFVLSPLFCIVAVLVSIAFHYSGRYGANLGAYAGCCAWLQLLMNVLLAKVRAEGNLISFAASLAVRNALVLILGFLFLGKYGNILPLVEALSYLIIIFNHGFYSKTSFAYFKKSQMFSHLKLGWPISFGYLLRMSGKTSSDFIFIFFISPQVYGIFAFVSVNYSIVITCLNMVSQSVMPRWIQAYSIERAKECVYSEIRFFLSKHAVLMLGGCIAFCIIYMLSTKWYFHQYSASYGVLPIYYLGLFFLLLSQIENYFIVVGESKAFLNLSTLTVFISLIVNVLAVLIYPTLEGLVIAFAIIRILVFCVSILMVKKSASKDKRKYQVPMERLA